MKVTSIAPAARFLVGAMIAVGLCVPLGAEETGPLILKGTGTSAFAALSDGSRFVCATGSAAEVWDRTTADRLLCIAHPQEVIGLAVAPHEGTLLTITAGEASPAHLWSLADGSVIRKYPNSFSGVDRGDEPQHERIWDLPLRRLASDTGFGFTSVAFSTKGDRFATGDNTGNIVVWDAKSVEKLARMKDDSSRIRSAAFSTDGARLLTHDADGSLVLWNIASESVVTRYGARALKNGASTARSRLAFSGDEPRFAFGATWRCPKSIVGLLRVCNASTGEVLHGMASTIGQDEPGAFTVMPSGCIAFLPRGRLLGNTGSVLQVWDIQRGAVVRRYVCKPPVNPYYANPRVASIEYLPDIDAVMIVEVENDENTFHADWTVVSVVRLSQFAEVQD